MPTELPFNALLRSISNSNPETINSIDQITSNELISGLASNSNKLLLMSNNKLQDTGLFATGMAGITSSGLLSKAVNVLGQGVSKTRFSTSNGISNLFSSKARTATTSTGSTFSSGVSGVLSYLSLWAIIDSVTNLFGYHFAPTADKNDGYTKIAQEVYRLTHQGEEISSSQAAKILNENTWTSLVTSAGTKLWYNFFGSSIVSLIRTAMFNVGILTSKFSTETLTRTQQSKAWIQPQGFPLLPKATQYSICKNSDLQKWMTEYFTDIDEGGIEQMMTSIEKYADLEVNEIGLITLIVATRVKDTDRAVSYGVNIIGKGELVDWTSKYEYEKPVFDFDPKKSSGYYIGGTATTNDTLKVFGTGYENKPKTTVSPNYPLHHSFFTFSGGAFAVVTGVMRGLIAWGTGSQGAEENLCKWIASYPGSSQVTELRWIGLTPVGATEDVSPSKSLVKNKDNTGENERTLPGKEQDIDEWIEQTSGLITQEVDHLNKLTENVNQLVETTEKLVAVNVANTEAIQDMASAWNAQALYNPYADSLSDLYDKTSALYDSIYDVTSADYKADTLPAIRYITDIQTITLPDAIDISPATTKVISVPYADIINPPKPPTYTPPIGGNGGLWAIYNPTISQIQSFGTWLWTTDPLERLKQMFTNNPMDGIISLHRIYASPHTSGTQNIVVGYLSSPVSSRIVSSRYTEIDCGTINIPLRYNNVLDYTGTEFIIYLPFIGMKPLDVGVILNSQLNVKYNIDLFTGTCVCNLWVIKNGVSLIMYTFSGNCAENVPLTSSDFTQMISAGLSMAAAVGTAALTGGATAAIGAGIGSIGGLGGSAIAKSGSISGNAGALGIKRPYLITVINDSYNADYDITGYPTRTTVKIGQLSGHVVATNVDLVGNMSDEESISIKSQLSSGVII